jgi:Zn-dependent protease
VGRDIPLGRIAGIRIGMSWLVPLIALLYVWNLAELRFPYEVPGQSAGAYWAAGLLGAFLFFASLLAHELGHALVARHEGIGVSGISLWLLGGVAKMESEPRTAGAELRIAGVGPLTSAAVGVGFFLVGLAFDGATGMVELFADLCGWLAFLNLLLAAFNLLPGAPLDGGRVLGALLWMQTRDQTRAQQVAARVGQVLGAALLAVGLAILASDDNGNGIWLAIVGAYIMMSAGSELRSTPTLGVLRAVRVGQVMEPDPPVLPEWMSVQDLVATAGRYRPHTAFAVQGPDGRLTGLLTGDAVSATDPRQWPYLRLADLAFPIDRVAIASVDDPVLSTVQRARSGATDRVIVLHPDGRIAGITGPEAAQRAADLGPVTAGN